jgi:hypothetical protein
MLWSTYASLELRQNTKEVTDGVTEMNIHCCLHLTIRPLLLCDAHTINISYNKEIIQSRFYGLDDRVPVGTRIFISPPRAD